MKAIVIEEKNEYIEFRTDCPHCHYEVIGATNSNRLVTEYSPLSAFCPTCGRNFEIHSLIK